MSDYNEHLISMAGGDGEADLLGEIEARAEAATEGPWTVERQTQDIGGYGPYEYVHIPEVTDLEWTPDGADCHMCGADFEEANAEFIAHARTDIPTLLAMVREQRARLDHIRALADNAPSFMGFDDTGTVAVFAIRAALKGAS
jgi:hypothetical protein